MSYRKDREQFIASMARISASDIAWRLLKEATTLHRLSELACSSEAADRDQVPCPKRYQDADSCLCRDYGNYQGKQHTAETCPGRPCSAGCDHVETGQHGTIPRHAVLSAHAERRVLAALKLAGPNLIVEFQGDPRGWPMTVKLSADPGRGIGVPNGPSGLRW